MHCLSTGVKVPKDVAIAGFNGLNFLAALPLQITTTETPRYEIGAAAAQWLVDGERSEERQKHPLKVRIRVGETT